MLSNEGSLLQNFLAPAINQDEFQDHVTPVAHYGQLHAVLSLILTNLIKNASVLCITKWPKEPQEISQLFNASQPVF